MILYKKILNTDNHNFRTRKRDHCGYNIYTAININHAKYIDI